VRTKVVVVVVTALCLLYVVVLGQRAWLLLISGSVVGVLLGAGVLVIPVLVAGSVLRELRFGVTTETMARELEAADGLPVDDLPRSPAGRIDRAAADLAFVRYQSEVEAAPGDWRAWFRLSCAYDMAGDRRRARASMRHAAGLRRPG